MALKLSLVLQALDKATAPIRKVREAVVRVGRATGLNRVGKALGGVGRGLRRVGGAAAGFVSKYKTWAAGLLGLFTTGTLGASGVMERLQTSFESMLGSAADARDMVDSLAKFAAETPFQLTGIGASAKKLLGFGVDQDKIIGKLRMLGDVAAGVGVPLGDMAQIYGKTMAKGKAQTEELNQMSERGIPILQALVDLAAAHGNEIGKEDVYKAAEKGQISFEAIEAALTKMTAEGGLFHDQMAKQSQTLFGLGSTLKDNVFNNLALVGDKIVETFQVKEGMKKLIAWLGELTAELKKPADAQVGVAAAITGTIDGIAAAVRGATGLWSTLTTTVSDAQAKIDGALKSIGTLWDEQDLLAPARAAWQRVTDWAGGLSLAGAGEAVITTMAGGITAVGSSIKTALMAAFDKVRALLPFSDAAEGPFSRLTAAGEAIIATIAGGITTAGDGIRTAFEAAIGSDTFAALETAWDSAIASLERPVAGVLRLAPDRLGHRTRVAQGPGGG